MTRDIRETLAAIRDSVPALNRATDDTQRLMREVGDYFQEVGLGLTARSEPIRIEGERGHLALEYARFDRKLRFVVRMDCNGDVDFRPWESCDRETKLRTFAALPALIGAIVDRVDRMTDQAGRIRETTEFLRDALEALKAATPAAPTTV